MSAPSFATAAEWEAQPGQNRKISERIRAFAPALILLALTIAVYLPLRKCGFISYDDPSYVTQNLNIQRGLRWTLKWAFTSFYAANWHPLTWLSHALDFHLFGLNPLGHHLVSLGIHVLNVLLLFGLIWRATSRTGAAFFIAAIFAVHPLNVQTVVWVAERKNLLCTLFWLLAIAAYGWYAKQPSWRRYALVVLVFAGALVSKPMAVSLPAVLLLLDFWPLRRSPDSAAPHRGRQIAKLFVEKIPLILLSITSAVLTLRAQAYEGAVNPAAFPWGLRVENAIVSYGRYLGKFFWPAKLAIIYPYPRGGLRLAQVIGIAVILLAITAIAVRLRRSSPWLLFGWLYFLGTLVPVIGLVQVGSQAMADRYMYLPIMGLLIATVLGCAEFVEARKLSKPIIAVAAIAVVAMLSWRTWVEQSYWADDVHLFSRAIAITGANNAAEDQLGLAIAKAGAVEQSLPHFQRALAINPRDEVAHADLGQYFLYHGDRTQAEREFREALADTRNRTLAATLYQNLGAIAWQQRRLDEAESRYQHAVALMPGEYRAWLNLGLIAFEEGKIDQAIRCDLQSLNAYPTSAGYVALARALRGANRIQEARAAYTEALKISPNFDLARRELEALPAVSH